ncbi:MAG: PA14 domain-containing protein [Nanoarchaeota archaeon]|nr:PA14 domain-containing protein [Nanoarchaeota archaeon]
MKRYGVISLGIVVILLCVGFIFAENIEEYNLDNTQKLTIPEFFSNVTSFFNKEYSNNNSIVHFIQLDFQDTSVLADNINRTLDNVDLEHVQEIGGKIYVIYPNYIEWTSQSKIIHIEIYSGNAELLNNSIFNYYSSLYPSDLDNYASPPVQSKSMNMLILALQSSSQCDRCGEGLFNNCDKDECYGLGSSCYLGWASCTGWGDCWCYDGSNIFNGNDDYCKYKGQRKNGCSRNEYDCDWDSECAYGLSCKGPIGGAADGCCYSYEAWDTNSMSCYDPRLSHGQYDCDWDSECKPGLVCDGKTATTDFNDEGCCYNYENWNNNAKVCNYAIYGTVYNSVLNSNGAFTQTPYSNLKLVIKISNHEASWLTTNYVETSTDSSGNFYFNPERYISSWNSLAFGVNLFNWKVDNIYAVQGNEVIGEWTNDFNNGFWGGEDSGYQSGLRSRHQIVMIHTNMPYWRISEFSSNTAMVKSMAIQTNEQQQNIINPPTNMLSNEKMTSNKIVGTLIIKDEGDYNFKVSSSGGVKLLIDGKEIINDWNDPINNTYERYGKVYLYNGNHTLSLDYYEYENNQRLNIDWETPKPIKVNQLYEVFIPSDINQKDYPNPSEGQKLMATAQVLSASSSYTDNQDNYQVSFIEDPKVYETSKSYTPSRRPLLLVHGMGGTDGYWDNLYPYFSNDFDVWQFYYPNDQEIKYSSALLREGTDFILKNYNSNSVDIVSHSMGGLVSHGYSSNLGQSPSGIRVSYGNNVNKIITLASPLYGSHLANVISETTDFGFGCKATEFVNNIREGIFGGVRSDAPAYRDIAVGSNFTFQLGNKNLNANIKYYTIAGTDAYTLVKVCREADDNTMDGLVSTSSASLLNKNIDLYTIYTTHSGFTYTCSDTLAYLFACIPLVSTPSPLQQISNMVYSFTKGTNLSSSNYQYKLTNLNYNPYTEGAVLIKTKENVSGVKLKFISTNKTYYLYRNQFNPIWYFWGNSGQDGLNIPQGKYEVLVGNATKGKEISIYPAQTSIYDLSICTPNWTLMNNWSSCQKNNQTNKDWIDTNYCGDNSTKPSKVIQTCDYCQPNISNPLYTEWSICSNHLRTKIKYYKDLNYNSCCIITNLSSDCIINNKSYQNITETEDCDIPSLSLSILEPQDKIYDSGKLNLKTNSDSNIIKLETIDYYSGNKNPRWTTLCSKNCKTYEKKINFNDGNHSLIVRGTSDKGLIYTSNVSFIIDTKDPQISTTKPSSNKYTNGSNFYIKYTEANCQTLKILINGQEVLSQGCTSGKNIEKVIPLDISSFNGQLVRYQFIISDIASNTYQSNPTKIKVDTTAPEIKNLNVSVSGRYAYFKMTVLNENKDSFNKVEYKDNSDSRPSWKSLCTNLKNEICEKKISFRTGNHDMIIRALDDAGNSDTKNISFMI